MIQNSMSGMLADSDPVHRKNGKPVRLYLPVELHERFRALAVREGVSMAMLARRVVEEFVARHGDSSQEKVASCEDNLSEPPECGLVAQFAGQPVVDQWCS